MVIVSTYNFSYKENQVVRELTKLGCSDSFMGRITAYIAFIDKLERNVMVHL